MLYTFNIDIQKYCQDSLAPNTTAQKPLVFAGAGEGVVPCRDAYADYYISVTYEGINILTNLLEDMGITADVSNDMTVVSSTSQHSESPYLFYYYGTAGFQDGHCLTKSSREIFICKDDNVYLSFLSPYNSSSYSFMQVKLYDAAGALLSEGIFRDVTNPGFTNLFSTNVGVNSLDATTYVDGSPNFLDPLLSYYTVSFGLAAYIPPWIYVRHTDTFTFTVNSACCGNRSLRLHWLNLLGGVDSYTFNSEKDLKIQTNSQTGRKSLNFSTGELVPHQKEDFGGFKYNSKASTAYELRSKFLSNTDALWLSDLLVSPKVYAEIDGALVPVIIEDAEQSISKESGFIRYGITARLANDLIIQRV